MNRRKIVPRPSDKGLVCHLPMYYGFNDNSTLVWDQSQNGKNGTASGSPVPLFPGFDLTAGSSQYVDVGTGPTSVNTVAMWVKMDDITANTDYPIDLNGTDYLTIVNGVLTQNGFAGGTAVLYTDGVAAATAISLATWHHIGITDTSAKNANDLDIGREGANYTSGVVADVRLYSGVLTAADMKTLYELTKWRFQT